MERRQLHTLRPVRDELLGGPTRRRDTPAQVVDLLVWNLDPERRDFSRGVDGGVDNAPSRNDQNAARIWVVKRSGSCQAAR
jgi:hypothetical protein